MWIYRQTEPNLYTVGFYDPDGKWHADTDWRTSEEAASRCRYLNGGN